MHTRRAKERVQRARTQGQRSSTRAAAASPPLSTERLLALQRTHGNAAVSGYLAVQRQAAPAGAPSSGPAAAGPSGAPAPPSPPRPAAPASRAPPAPPLPAARSLAAPAAVTDAPLRPAPSVERSGRPETSVQEQRLQAAVADAHAAIAGLPDLSLPDATSAGGRVLVEALARAERDGRDRLAGAAAAAVRSTAEAAAQQAAAVTAGERASAAAVRGHVESARGHVAGAVTEHALSVRRSAAEHQERVATWHGQAAARAQDEVARRRDAMTAAGAEQAAQVHAAGDQAATTASTSMSAAASSARSTAGGGGGSDPVATGHAEVRSRLGGDAGGQLERGAGQVGGQLRGHAGEAAGALQHHAAEAAAAVGGHVSTLHGQLAETAGGTTTELGRAAGASVAELHAGGRRAMAQLGTAETKLLDTVEDQAATERDRIHGAAAEAAAGLRDQAKEAVAGAQQRLAEHAGRIAAAQVGEQAAAEAAPQVRDEVVAACGGSADQARAAEGAVAGHLAAAGTAASSALAHVPQAAGPNVQAAARSVGADAARASVHAGAAMARAVGSVAGAADQALTRTAQGLDQAVARARDGLAGAAGAATQSLDQHTSEAGGRTVEAISGLHRRIGEGDQRFDARAAVQRSVQRSILGRIGSWFADQFRDLWNMLKSPAFWVGLIVTIVLLPVMGPGALVVGGIAGGAVSGIQQNIREGRSWYSPGNILKQAAIGGLAGAAMALGGIGIAALGLEGAAATAAVMGLSAVIGIVVNAVNGERWDKGLLANLLLAWLFRRIGGRVPEEVPPEGEAPPAPGGRTTTRVPGLYEGIDPTTAPEGWEFTDTQRTVGNERMVTTEVKAPDGSTGHVIRGLDVTTGEVVLHEAFLDRIPSDVRWIPTQPEMVPGRGTPLETYLTMRQMRLLESARRPGAPVYSGPHTVRISTIVNVRTVLKLAQLTRPPNNMSPDQAALQTHSVQYASNSITQTGGRIAGAHVEGGFPRPAGSIGASPEQLAEAGLSPSDSVLFFFDITLDVVPADAPPAPEQKPVLVPAPVHVPDDDQD